MKARTLRNRYIVRVALTLLVGTAIVAAVAIAIAIPIGTMLGLPVGMVAIVVVMGVIAAEVLAIVVRSGRDVAYQGLISGLLPWGIPVLVGSTILGLPSALLGSGFAPWFTVGVVLGGSAVAFMLLGSFLPHPQHD